VRKFGVTAGDDLENLTQVLGEGASKLQGEWNLAKLRAYIVRLIVTFVQELYALT
jgi:hypothetical protein